MLDQEFQFNPSRTYAMLFGGIIIASLVIISWLPWPFILKLIMLIASAAYAFYYFKRFILLDTQNAILSLRRLSDGEWLLQSKSSKERALLCGDSIVTNIVSVLNFRISNEARTKTCIVFQDSLKPDQYRRLIIAIRFAT